MALLTLGLLAKVPDKQTGRVDQSLLPPSQTNDFTRLQHTPHFGDPIAIKPKNTLRVAFQNIGGFPTTHTDIKEDYIRIGLSLFDIDIFGIAETN